MRTLLAGVAIVAVLLAANVVAAGVLALLGGLVKDIAPAAGSQGWPWMLVGAAAIGATLMFLRGTIHTAKDLFTCVKWVRRTPWGR